MSSRGENDGIWREELRLHSYDVDFTQTATLEAICRRFLEAAWNHAEALGVGFAHLAQQQRLWVLVRLLIKFERYPRWGELVQLNTWPRAAKSVFALREFEVTDSAGEHLGGGSSAWVVLDVNTKKPQRIEKLISGIQTGPERLAIGSEPSKIEPCAGATVLTTTARYSDVDLNGHVNSGRYIGWLADSYPFGFHKTHQATQIEINYLGETTGGEEISISAVETVPGTWLHGIVKTHGSEVCRARIFWRERPSCASP